MAGSRFTSEFDERTRPFSCPAPAVSSSKKSAKSWHSRKSGYGPARRRNFASPISHSNAPMGSLLHARWFNTWQPKTNHRTL